MRILWTVSKLLSLSSASQHHDPNIFLSLLQKLTKTQDADYIYNFLPENLSRELYSYLHTPSRV